MMSMRLAFIGFLASLTMSAPALSANAPECVVEGLTAEQNAELDRIILRYGINREGVTLAYPLIIPVTRTCIAAHGWSEDAGFAGTEIALYRRTMLVLSSDRGMGAAMTARVEAWIASEDPALITGLVDGSLQGRDRNRLLSRMINTLGADANHQTITYILARGRLATHLAGFAAL
jgi:hypothetical protein